MLFIIAWVLAAYMFISVIRTDYSAVYKKRQEQDRLDNGLCPKCGSKLKTKSCGYRGQHRYTRCTDCEYISETHHKFEFW